MDLLQILQEEFSIRHGQAEAVVELLKEGNTVPFIARYRKERTGSLDDQTLRKMQERIEYLEALLSKKDELSRKLQEQGNWTSELERAIEHAQTVTALEDIYRPFRPKRKTRASVAKENGLAPLAEDILKQGEESPQALAEHYLNDKVQTVQDALQGAIDILAEQISENPNIRQSLYTILWRNGVLSVQGKDLPDNSPYQMYNDFHEAVCRVANHRVLAINRGEKENFLHINIECDSKMLLLPLEKTFIKGDNASSDLVGEACSDSLSRLLLPAVIRRIRKDLTERANQASLELFASNLRQLLLRPPIKGKVVMGVDPAYRTGCKLAVVDGTGKVLDIGVIFPTPPQSKVEQAKKTVIDLVKRHHVQLFAIGNGTASRETEAFIASVIQEIDEDVAYLIVDESGASIYSASKLAAEEFPEYDVTIRSSVSIARRVQDPLAELVKIEPKGIGVGQYQHDMPQAELGQTLDRVVEDCVNAVGVNLNTASVSLLQRVSGIHVGIAKNIIQYRDENGAFHNRRELLKVPKLGKKAFEQSAGFMRIRGGDNPLDNTAVHPESYQAAERLLNICGFSKAGIGRLNDLKQAVDKMDKQDLAEEIGIGVPTLLDIVQELTMPGRDPRDMLDAPILRQDIMEIKDLRRGMKLSGTVRNIIDFGCFVDIGVHQDGLVHISQISDHFIQHPNDVVKVGDIVTVWILDLDLTRNRIALTMRGEPSLEK